MRSAEVNLGNETQPEGRAVWRGIVLLAALACWHPSENHKCPSRAGARAHLVTKPRCSPLPVPVTVTVPAAVSDCGYWASASLSVSDSGAQLEIRDEPGLLAVLAWRPGQARPSLRPEGPFGAFKLVIAITMVRSESDHVPLVAGCSLAGCRFRLHSVLPRALHVHKVVRLM